MIVKEMQHVGKKFQAVQKGFTGNLSPTLTPAQPILPPPQRSEEVQIGGHQKQSLSQRDPRDLL